MAYTQDISRPFSQSKNTVDYIKSLPGANQVIAVDGYNTGPMFSAYLGRKLYYLDIDRIGSFCVWKKTYFPVPRLTIAQELVQSTYLQGLDQFILISNRQIDTAAIYARRVGSGVFHFTLLKDFDNSIIGEDFHVYRVTGKIR